MKTAYAVRVGVRLSACGWAIGMMVSGALDPAFVPVFNDNVRTLALQTDGRILVGGQFTTVK